MDGIWEHVGHGKKEGGRTEPWQLQHLWCWQEEAEPSKETESLASTCLALTPGVCAQLVLACGLADGP